VHELPDGAHRSVIIWHLFTKGLGGRDGEVSVEGGGAQIPSVLMLFLLLYLLISNISFIHSPTTSIDVYMYCFLWGQHAMHSVSETVAATPGCYVSFHLTSELKPIDSSGHRFIMLFNKLRRRGKVNLIPGTQSVNTSKLKPRLHVLRVCARVCTFDDERASEHPSVTCTASVIEMLYPCAHLSFVTRGVPAWVTHHPQ